MFSLGMYFVPWKYRFTDYGSLGMFAKLQVSSHRGSGDIFRRIIYGIRVESRSRNPIIAKGNIEIGLTVNSIPGTFQKKRIIGAERFFANVGIPYGSIDFVSLYCQFKTEWNITSGPSFAVYEIRIGAVFDPLQIFD